MTSWSAMIEPKKALLVAASVATSVVLARTLISKFIVTPPNNSNDVDVVTVVIDYGFNLVYEAAKSYLSGKVSPSTRRLVVAKQESDPAILVTGEGNAEYTDVFDGVEYRWHSAPSSFELTFDRRHREEALGTYLPHVVDTWRAVKDGQRQVQWNLLQSWSCVTIEHPATLDTIAMEPEVKKAVKDDLERFVRRRDSYRRVGKMWKRSYLLYGPPGTGKSSLVAVMADFLKFDVYKLSLKKVIAQSSSLQNVLTNTTNRSILVIEDADECPTQQIQPTASTADDGSEEPGTEAPDSFTADDGIEEAGTEAPNSFTADDGIQEAGTEAPDSFTADDGNEEAGTEAPEQESKEDRVTLSGVLSMIDGLMSTWDERVIVVTTNHKERLDPAILRRMDLHIHMSYCTPTGFRTLAESYHGVKDHRLFQEIERLIGEEVNVTPEEVTDELMRSEDADEALEFLLRFLTDKTDDPKRRKDGKEIEESVEAEK